MNELIPVLSLIVAALAIIAGAAGVFGQTAHAQMYKADSITITVSYSAAVDEWMT
jgi:hypothetical protein